MVVEEGIALEGRRIKPNSLYISWVSREYEDEQGMKMLIDGEEDDVVGYQPEGYVVMITMRATNQSAFRNRCGWYSWLRNLGCSISGERKLENHGAYLVAPLYILAVGAVGYQSLPNQIYIILLLAITLLPIFVAK